MGPAAQERGKNEKVSWTFTSQILVSRIPENSLELFLLSFSFCLLFLSFFLTFSVQTGSLGKLVCP